MTTTTSQPTATTTNTSTTSTTSTTVLTGDITDEYVGRIVGKVDVLYIIDNSGAMAEEQAALTSQFSRFMQFFMGSGIDYHIGVVSTDMQAANHSGKLQSWSGGLYIDDSTPNPDGVFTTMATLGTAGSDDERGRDAGYTALVTLANGYNSGFLRPDSGLSIVVLSDDDDHSSLMTNTAWINWLLAEQAARPFVNVSSIVALTSGPQVADVGAAYLDVSNQVGGTTWEVSDLSLYASGLEQIGGGATGLVAEYVLTQLPELGTLVVEAEENGVIYSFEEDLDWAYIEDSNSIVLFEFWPSSSSTVRISYTIAAPV